MLDKSSNNFSGFRLPCINIQLISKKQQNEIKKRKPKYTNHNQQSLAKYKIQQNKFSSRYLKCQYPQQRELQRDVSPISVEIFVSNTQRDFITKNGHHLGNPQPSKSTSQNKVYRNFSRINRLDSGIYNEKYLNHKRIRSQLSNYRLQALKKVAWNSQIKQQDRSYIRKINDTLILNKLQKQRLKTLMKKSINTYSRHSTQPLQQMIRMQQKQGALNPQFRTLRSNIRVKTLQNQVRKNQNIRVLHYLNKFRLYKCFKNQTNKQQLKQKVIANQNPVLIYNSPKQRKVDECLKMSPIKSLLNQKMMRQI